MTNSKNNSDKQKKIADFSQQPQTAASPKPEQKKERFKFKKENMYEITYDF